MGLDLYALAAELQKTPMSKAEAARVLQRALEGWLEQTRPKAGTQQFVVVTGNSLLARYGASLKPFFEVAGECRMCIFVVEPREANFQSGTPLPSYVHVQPTATLTYLESKLGDQAVIGETAQ